VRDQSADGGSTSWVPVCQISIAKFYTKFREGISEKSL
jgi:hypothetical protein